MINITLKDIHEIFNDEYALTYVLVETDLKRRIHRAKSWTHYQRAITFLNSHPVLRSQFISDARARVHSEITKPKDLIQVLYYMQALSDLKVFLDPNQFANTEAREIAALVFFKLGWN